jgi:hypothetical protein
MRLSRLMIRHARLPAHKVRLGMPNLWTKSLVVFDLCIPIAEIQTLLTRVGLRSTSLF